MTPRVPSLTRANRRPTLLVVVYGVSLVLVVLTAAALVSVVSDHIKSSAIDSSVAADRSLARSFANETNHSSFLTGTISTDTLASVNADLAALIDPVGSGIIQIKVYDPNATVRFSNNRPISSVSAPALTTNSPMRSTIARRSSRSARPTAPRNRPSAAAATSSRNTCPSSTRTAASRASSRSTATPPRSSARWTRPATTSSG